MSSTGINTLTSGTINGLTSLDLTDLTTDTLNADNIDGNFFSIETIEANDVQVDNELELTNNGFITIGKGTGSEITITDTQVGFLDGITSNIQTQINNSNTDLTQIEADVTAVEQEVDVLNNKTIYQSTNTTEQKTIFSNKLILSSLSNLDVGTTIQANTANVGILTTQQSTNTSNISSLSTQQTTNTSNISSLSTQQTTNTFNITQQGLSIGTTSGGPINSLFDRVKYITTATNNTYLEKALTIQTTGSSVSKVAISEGEIYIYKDDPELYFYRNDRPFAGPSAYLNVTTGGQFNIINYQKDRNIVIGTAGGTSTSARIDINSNNVYINSVDVNDKFDTIDSDILGNSNAITSLNVSIQNNLSKITTNTNNINALQVKVPPVGSIMMYAGSTSPTNWYICNGALISKSSNIELWGVLGDTYLNGRPAQTLSFYLPDMRQLFVTGAGDNSTYPVNASNKSVGDYNGQSIMEHGHNYERPTNQFKASANAVGTNVWRSNTQSTTSGGVILPGGGIIATDSENKPYCMAMNYIIKK